MRGIIIGSSMSMPTDELNYNDSYIHLLREKFPDVEWMYRLQRSSSIDRLINEGFKSNGWDNLEFYNPDFAIIHLGVTDASPRYLPRRKIATKLLNMSFLAKYVYKYLRKHSYRKIEYCDVLPDDFRNKVIAYAERCKKLGTTLIIVKISMVHEKLVKTKSPEMNKSYKIYNQIFDEIAAQFDNVILVDGLNGENDVYQSDLIHANEKGQLVFFNQISTAIENIKNIQV